MGRPGLVRFGGVGPTGLVVPVLLLVFAVPPAASQPASDLLHLLHPGGREQADAGPDPFLSLARGEAGWWHQKAFTADSFLGVTQRSFAPITGRLSSQRGVLELIETELAVGKSLPVSRGAVRAAFFASEGKASARWTDGDAELGFRERGSRYSGLLRLEKLLPRVDLQLEFPLGAHPSRGVAAPLRLGVRGSWPDRIWLHGRLSRSIQREPVVLSLEDEVVDSPLNAQTDEIQYGARLRIGYGVSVESRVQERRYEPRESLSDRLRYEFQPDGWSVLRQNEIVWRHRAGIGLVVRRTRMEMQGEGRGFWGGQRYLLLHHLDARIRSWLGAAEYELGSRQRLLAEWERAEIEGFGRAKIESWRFASWQTAWLNGERVFLGSLSGEWDRIHVAYRTHWGDRRFEGGLSWYEIRVEPETKLDAWSKLVFGRADEETTTLASDRYSLAAFSLGARIPLNALRLSLWLHQFVHFDDHVDEVGPEGDAPVGVEGTSSADGWMGGTWFQMALGWSF